MTLLMVMVMVLILGAMGAASFFQVYVNYRNIDWREAETEALYSAQTAVEELADVAQDGGSWQAPTVPGNPPLFQLPAVYFSGGQPAWRPVYSKETAADKRKVGEYKVEFKNQAAQSVGSPWQLLYCVITARNIPRPQASAVTRTIDVMIKAQSPLNFFMTTISQLTIGDGTTINGPVMAPVVIIHSGNNGAIQINGSVSYTSSLTIQRPGGPQNSSTFTAANYSNGSVNITGVIQPQNIKFVTIDLSSASNKNRQIAIQDQTIHYGAWPVPGAVFTRASLGPTGNNGIYYATGDITFPQAATFSESMSFFSEGDIHIRGNLQPAAGSNAKLALCAQGTIYIDSAPGTVNLLLTSVFMLANGGVKTGPYVAPNIFNSLTITGAMSFRGLSGVSAIGLNNYIFRTYNQIGNPYLNPPPGINYLSSIVEWSMRGDPAL
jgi:hypothetical protein